jgi:hypothetical protein
MSIPFGPQLIGETEKTLTAVLRHSLEGTGLKEPQWVTLRLAGLLDGTVDEDGLVAAVADRAHFENAAELVGDVTDRGLVEDGRISAAGRELLATVLGRSDRTAGKIWVGFPTADIEATTRVLNEVLQRARAVLV